jgi:hypothetical protein
MWLLQPGARLDLPASTASRLFFVLSGTGFAGAHELDRHFAIKAEPGEAIRLEARSELRLLSFLLPPVSEDWTAPALASFEPVPGEAVPEDA